ncbi:hypothetical protein F3Y22_tig00111503pilonHSYRG00056 [Hibiscus syriacus]|uniref:Reverse transcriptase Ty1/copia-type domain-containing protein n=1 Tax=Hibiscus syriacus TaxID=106335 RepID=A0A6A2YEW6_HIBSY|nr:hypothetical protein F3Y22_tig00111503pilonHSYRG00056 [Hibiscus syriacus]
MITFVCSVVKHLFMFQRMKDPSWIPRLNNASYWLWSRCSLDPSPDPILDDVQGDIQDGMHNDVHDDQQDIEPECYKEAMESECKDQWIEVMKDEIQSMHENTFKLVKLPKDKRALKNRWIYRENGRLRLHLVSSDVCCEEDEEIEHEEQVHDLHEKGRGGGGMKVEELWNIRVKGEGSSRCHEMVDYHRHHGINGHHSMHVWRQPCVSIR